MGPLNKIKLEFIVQLGKALHEAGASAHRLENILSSVTENLNLTGEFFSTPTSINCSFYVEKRNISRLVRVYPGSTNLYKLMQADLVADKVVAGQMSIDAGLSKLRAIRKKDNHYPKIVTVAGYSMVSSSVAYLSGGNVKDIVIASLFSAFVAIIHLFRRELRIIDIYEALVAFIVTLVVYMLPTSIGIHPTIILIAGLIIPLPGYYITMAMSELAANHLTSGTARFMGGMVTVAKLTFGVYLAHKIAPVTNEITYKTGIYLPEWYRAIALLITSAGFMINFRATFKEYGWMLLASIISSLGIMFLKPQFGVEAGTFLCAALVAIASNLFARVIKKPAHIMLAPGTILLVPGVFAFQTFNFLFEKNVMQGLETAINMFIIAISIVAGILIGNLFVNPKRNL